MAQLAKYIEVAITSSELPLETQAQIREVLSLNVASGSVRSFVAPSDPEEDKLSQESAEIYESQLAVGEVYGVDPGFLSIRGFDREAYEALVDQALAEVV